MNIKSLVGEVKSKKENFLENYVVGGGVPAADNSVMPIMRVAWKESGEDSVDTNAGHEELAKGAENQGTGVKVATITTLKN